MCFGTSRFRKPLSPPSQNQMSPLQMNANEALDANDLAMKLMRRPLSPEQAEVERRLFLDAIKPIQQLKVQLYSLYLPTIILDSEGRLVSSAYPDEMLEMVKKLDEEIERIAASWIAP